MSKKVLIISGSPRKEGNSETLCEQFAKGAWEAGHTVEMVYLREKKIGFCIACYACKKTGVCVQKDDMSDILKQMEPADVIVLSTPVYFYQMNGQMKTMIDRTLACYYNQMLAQKEFYFIATAAEEKPAMERTMDGLRGLTDCIPGAKVQGTIYGARAWQLGEIKGNPAMQEAYEMGRKA
jgi:multimeric flavodoxin WrbA